MTEYSVEPLGQRESSFYPRFPKKHCFRKVPTLRPFVLLAKSNVVMKMSTEHLCNNTDRENGVTWRKPCSSATFSTKRSHLLTWTEPGLRGEGQRLTF
jgi:hypothetical protein